MNFTNHQTRSGDVHHRHITVNPADTGDTGQGIATLLDDFTNAIFGQMFGHHKDLARTDSQIHCPAHRRDRLRLARAPVSQIPAG